MTVPCYISENKSDMRGIKHGWYAIEDDGNLSSGPFPSFEACVTKISQPANGTMAPKLQRRAELNTVSTGIRRLGRRQEVLPKTRPLKD